MWASPVDTDAPFNVLDSGLINMILNGEQKPIACLIFALFQIGHQFLQSCESENSLQERSRECTFRKFGQISALDIVIRFQEDFS